MDIPTFKTKAEKIAWLVANKDKVIAHKKASIKHADGLLYLPMSVDKKQGANKAVAADAMELLAKVAINTTNIFDSHDDVHMPGIWDKSIEENKYVMHLQEHGRKFKDIIADDEDLKVSIMDTTFKAIGFDLSGTTQVLIFESNVKKDRNTYMFIQYKDGHVKQHSVGMYYVKLVLCVNDENYGAEKEAWDKYYPFVANKEAVEDNGYFYAVLEAKLIEGSAVPLGSNYATPTLDIKTIKSEPGQPTRQPEPVKTTPQTKSIFINLLN